MNGLGRLRGLAEAAAIRGDRELLLLLHDQIAWVEAIERRLAALSARLDPIETIHALASAPLPSEVCLHA